MPTILSFPQEIRLMRMGHPAYTPTNPPSCRPGALTRRPDLVHNENCCVRCKLRIGITCAVLNVPVRSCGVCTVDSESAGKGVAQEGGGQVVERGELVSEPRLDRKSTRLNSSHLGIS